MGGGGSISMVMVRGRRRMDPVIYLLAEKVDAESNESDAEARSGMSELIGEHRMLPPLVCPPEELSSRSQRLIRHCKTALISLSLRSFTSSWMGADRHFLLSSLFSLPSYYFKLLYYPLILFLDL
ncbi:hypothetical protein SDJN03_10202, partial [Cucurbita argyrosperma subsp. sororia]